VKGSLIFLLELALVACLACTDYALAGPVVRVSVDAQGDGSGPSGSWSAILTENSPIAVAFRQPRTTLALGLAKVLGSFPDVARRSASLYRHKHLSRFLRG